MFLCVLSSISILLEMNGNFIDLNFDSILDKGLLSHFLPASVPCNFCFQLQVT